MGKHREDACAGLSIGKAGHRLGITTTVFKGLATVYEFPIADRTDGGHRRYPVDQLDLIDAAMRRGHPLPAAFRSAKRTWQARTNDLMAHLRLCDLTGADALVSDRLELWPGNLRIGVAHEIYAAACVLEAESPEAATTALVDSWAARWIDRIAAALPSSRGAPGVLLVDATDGSGTLPGVALRLLELLTAANRTPWIPVTLPATRLGHIGAALAAVGAQRVDAAVVVGHRADAAPIREAGLTAPILTLAREPLAHTLPMPADPAAWTARVRRTAEMPPRGLAVSAA